MLDRKILIVSKTAMKAGLYETTLNTKDLLSKFLTSREEGEDNTPKEKNGNTTPPPSARKSGINQGKKEEKSKG